MDTRGIGGVSVPGPSEFTIYLRHFPSCTDGTASVDVQPFILYVLWAATNFHACPCVFGATEVECLSMLTSGCGIGVLNPREKKTEQDTGDTSDNEKDEGDQEGSNEPDEEEGGHGDDRDDEGNEDGNDNSTPNTLSRKRRRDSADSIETLSSNGEKHSTATPDRTYTVKGNSFRNSDGDLMYRTSMAVEQLLNRNGNVCGYRVFIRLHDSEANFVDMLLQTLREIKTYAQAQDELRRRKATSSQKAYLSRFFPYLPSNAHPIVIQDFRAHVTGYLGACYLSDAEITEYLAKAVPDLDTLLIDCRKTFKTDKTLLSALVCLFTDKDLERQITSHLNVCKEQVDGSIPSQLTVIPQENMVPYFFTGNGLFMPRGYQPSVEEIATAMGLPSSATHTMQNLKERWHTGLDMSLASVPLHRWFESLMPEYERALRKSQFLRAQREIVTECRKISTGLVTAMRFSVIASIEDVEQGLPGAIAESYETIRAIRNRQMKAWNLVTSEASLTTRQQSAYGEAFVKESERQIGKPYPYIPSLCLVPDPSEPSEPPLSQDLCKKRAQIRKMSSRDILAAYSALKETPDHMQRELEDVGRRGGDIVECMRFHLYNLAGISGTNIGTRMAPMSQILASYLMMLTDGFGIWSLHYDVFMMWLIAICAGVPNDKGGYRVPVMFVGEPGAGKSFGLSILPELVPEGMMKFAGTETTKAATYREWKVMAEGPLVYHELPSYLESTTQGGKRQERSSGLISALAITEGAIRHELTTKQMKDGEGEEFTTKELRKVFDAQMIMASNFSSSADNHDTAFHDRCAIIRTPAPPSGAEYRNHCAYLNTCPTPNSGVRSIYNLMAVAMTSMGRAQVCGLIPAPTTRFLDASLAHVMTQQRRLGLRKCTSREIRTLIQWYKILVQFYALNMTMLFEGASTCGNDEELERYERLCPNGVWLDDCAMFPDPLDERIDRGTGRMDSRYRERFVFPDLFVYVDESGSPHVTPFVVKGPKSRSSSGREIPRRPFKRDEMSHRQRILATRYFLGPNPDALILALTNQQGQQSYMQPGLACIINAIFTFSMGCSVAWLRVWLNWVEAWYTTVMGYAPTQFTRDSYVWLLMGGVPFYWDPVNLRLPATDNAVLVLPIYHSLVGRSSGGSSGGVLGTETCFVGGREFKQPIPIEPTSSEYTHARPSSSGHQKGETYQMAGIQFLPLDNGRCHPSYLTTSGPGRSKEGTKREVYWKIMFSWLSKMEGSDLAAALKLFKPVTFMEAMEGLSTHTAMLPVIDPIPSQHLVTMDVLATLYHPRRWKGQREQPLIRYGPDDIPYINIWLILLSHCHVKGEGFIENNLLAIFNKLEPVAQQILTALPDQHSGHPAARSVWTTEKACGDAQEDDTILVTNPSHLSVSTTTTGGVIGTDPSSDPWARAAVSMGPVVAAVSSIAQNALKPSHSLPRTTALTTWQREFNRTHDLHSPDGTVYMGNTRQAINAAIANEQKKGDIRLRTACYPHMLE